MSIQTGPSRTTTDRPSHAVPGRAPQVRHRKLFSWMAIAALVGWSVHRALVPGGELVNSGGLPLVRELAVTVSDPSLDPDFLVVVGEAALVTLALSLLGTVGALVIGLFGGLVLSDAAWGESLPQPIRLLRMVLRAGMVATRSVHELVWALLFVTVLGVDPLVAVLALAIPFGAQSAQVFTEAFDAVPTAPLRALRSAGVRRVPAVAYALLPGTAPMLLSYSFYRFECAMRSAVVLGVAGVGGLGLELTVSLQSRNWDEVWTLIGALMILSAVVELWSSRVRTDVAVVTCADWPVGRQATTREADGLARTTRWSLYALVPATVLSWWWLGIEPGTVWSERARSQTSDLLADLWPPALPDGGWSVLLSAVLDTLAMAILAMALAVVVTLVLGPWAGRPRADRVGRRAGVVRRAAQLVARVVLLVLRSVPPTVWAVVALLAFFPGILPGALALGLYTGGILGRLVAEAWETMSLRPRDALLAAGVSRPVAAVASLLPPSASHLTTYTLYRFEICVRETAVVGVVGAAGLGQLLSERLGAFDFEVVSTVLIASLVVSLVVELVSRRVRRELRG